MAGLEVVEDSLPVVVKLVMKADVVVMEEGPQTLGRQGSLVEMEGAGVQAGWVESENLFEQGEEEELHA